jgi:PAS domain S-box-containing protein
MIREEFLRFANGLSGPTLLVSAEGLLVAANRGAGRRFGVPPEELSGRSLSELTEESPERVAEYLRACSRSSDPLPGSLTLLRQGEAPLPCRTEGAVVRPRSEGEPALLLLQLLPRSEAPSQFAVLTERIADLTREIARRHQVEEELRAHREWLRVTLASIGDAVIATDEHGCITYMNSVAQMLTGWKEEEAEGRSLESVFRIVNEETRAPVEHPVERVLRDGQIVGLANHTILIARDGTEYPIDDSAAPIQEDEGALLGVVLVFREVSERRRMERELTERAEALAAAARRRDEFLAMLAHELRNPLAPIRNAVQLLKRLGPQEPRIVRAHETIDRQAAHQARLIDDLLEVSRVTQGRIVLRPERVDLTQLVGEEVEDHRVLMDAAGIALDVKAPPGPLWVTGDPARLHQIVANLLSNAVRFTERGGRVELTLEVLGAPGAVRGADGPDAPRGSRPASGADQEAVLTVRDTGIGIDAEVLPHIFEAFAQADRSLERTRGGLGLGLTLVKSLVALHGGEVQAESDGLGQGATFTVVLPLSDEPETLRPISATPDPAEPIRVLVIDDNPDMADSLADLLRVVGFTAEAAYSGPQGIAAGRRLRPRVILCDLGLPGMNGYEVARALRNEPATASALLIAISGYGDREHEQRSHEAGFDAHLIKPVDFTALQKLLQESVP